MKAYQSPMRRAIRSDYVACRGLRDALRRLRPGEVIVFKNSEGGYISAKLVPTRQ